MEPLSKQSEITHHQKYFIRVGDNHGNHICASHPVILDWWVTTQGWILQDGFSPQANKNNWDHVETPWCIIMCVMFISPQRGTMCWWHTTKTPKKYSMHNINKIGAYTGAPPGWTAGWLRLHKLCWHICSLIWKGFSPHCVGRSLILIRSTASYRSWMWRGVIG